MSIYLESDDFKGDVTAAGFYDHVELLSVKFDVSNVDDGLKTMRARPAKLSYFVITKLIDNTSPSFLKVSVKRNRIDSIIIKFARDSGDGNKQFMEYKLSECVIPNYSLSADTGKEPVETIALAYKKITYKYTGFDMSSRRQGQQVITHDLGDNE